MRGAEQALLDQVFVDGPAGSFDTHPELVTGCIDTGAYNSRVNQPRYLPEADMNSDGWISMTDYWLFVNGYHGSPGPSGFWCPVPGCR